jgi:molybdate transport system permease protein
VLAPIALPPTVAGLALLGLLDRHGLLGQWIYREFDWQLPFTTWAVIYTGVFVGLPFLVLITESNFRQLPREIEDAAVIDRASNFHILRSIAIPQARNGVITGFVLAWARILGEFGATMMFAGSLPGTTQTWTMQIYQELDVSPSTAYSLSVLLVGIAMAIIVLLRRPLREAFR